MKGVSLFISMYNVKYITWNVNNVIIYSNIFIESSQWPVSSRKNYLQPCGIYTMALLCVYVYRILFVMVYCAIKCGLFNFTITTFNEIDTLIVLMKNYRKFTFLNKRTEQLKTDEIKKSLRKNYSSLRSR